MLIGFEASALQGRKSGVGYYTENMLAGIMRAAPEHDYVLFSNRPADETRRAIGVERVHDGRRFPVRAVWMQAVLPWTLRRVKPAICHFTNYLAPVSTPCPYVVTMYDMSVFLTPRYHNFKKMVLDRTLIPSVARRASAIVTISQSARRDILRCLKVPREKVRVIMGAASEHFRPVSDPERLRQVRSAHGLDGPYILYVGTIEPRKNLPRLVEAFARLKTWGLPHKLAIVGQTGWNVEPLHTEIKKHGLERNVIFTGYVPFDDLPALYSAADAMAFPSLYEGFGLPVIEAMACGAPVVTSAGSSLAEVAGDAALLIDPTRPEEIASALHSLVTNPDLAHEMSRRGQARAAHFTWDKVARTTLGIYDSVLSVVPSTAYRVPSGGLSRRDMPVDD